MGVPLSIPSQDRDITRTKHAVNVMPGGVQVSGGSSGPTPDAWDAHCSFALGDCDDVHSVTTLGARA